MPGMKTYYSLSEGQRQPAKRRSWRWWLLPLVMAVAGSGCTRKAMVAADVNPAGAYTLVSVDGKQVPCEVEHQGHSLRVSSGSFDIDAGGTCTSKVVFAPPSGKEVTRVVKATYTQQGAKLTMRWERAGMTGGTVESNTFTMNNEGMLFQYRK